MGKILEQIYKIVEAKGGLPGRVKLAQKTGVSKQQATFDRDKAAVVKRFKRAATEILETDIEELLK
ncbi:MAG: hypothetical protein E4H23_07310 [Chrysiogenales bacterium]|nr:MAG: hypothetical protein E4H23_07310 [Chrysiogenales bacterium]